MSHDRSDFERFIGPDRRRSRRPTGLAAVVTAIAVLVVLGLILLYPTDSPELDLEAFGFSDEVVDAVVVGADDQPCSYAPEFDCHLATFEFQSPDSEGLTTTYQQEFSTDPGAPTFTVGEPVLIGVNETEEGTTFQYYDRDRSTLLWIVALVFSAAVIVLGRLRGVAALIGLLISLLVLLWFIVPAIISGRDAVLVAIVGGSAIVLVALYLAHGVTPLTHVAAIGAFGALALTAILSWVAVSAAHFSGLADEESFYLLGIPGVSLSGILLAGVVLGAIGALDDVTVTQASAVWEVRSANPDLGARELFASGLRVGRDHIASTVNTLLLAYAGAALPLLVLYSLSSLPVGVVANSEVVSVEIIRTLVGSLGLVAAVPLTTWLAAREAVKHG